MEKTGKKNYCKYLGKKLFKQLKILSSHGYKKLILLNGVRKEDTGMNTE